MRILRLLSLLCICVIAAFSTPLANAQRLSVQPAVSASDVNASLPVAVSVGGVSVAATGTVTLTGGGYSSGAQTLDNNGNFTFVIPANSLIVGTDTLTVNYSGDTNYAALSGSATVKVGASVPLKMSVIGPVATQVVAGAGHTCVLSAQSITVPETIQCWGSNDHGQLGNGTLTDTTTPVQVDKKFYTTKDFNDLEVIALVVGDNHTCALLPDSGQPVCWGANASGQLGNGSNADSSTPVMTTGIKIYNKVAALAAGSAHTCALLEDGTAQCWGDNAHGQLGDGSFAGSSSPIAVNGVTNAIAIAAGGNHTCALLADQSVMCWGENSNGQLGNGSIIDNPTPVAVGGLGGSAILLALGGTHTCALLTDGTLRCWGGNAHGQLGNGSIIDSPTPFAVSGIIGATTLAAGKDHTCAVIAAGGRTVACWGSNALGQLGDDSITDRTTPVHTVGLTKVAALALGGSHTCEQNEIGMLACWGDNSTGQLGNGTKQAGGVLSPLPVNGMGGTSATVSTGDNYACALTAGGTANLGAGGALKTNGALFCWGTSNGGDLGDGLNKNSATPVEVAGLTNTVKEIFTGGGAACAVLTDASVDCWGYSNSVKSTTPIKITGFSGTVSQLSITPYAICALISNGTVQCWGNNYEGDLGDGTNNNSTTPVTVVGISSATAISSSTHHTCALLSGGTVECWGDYVTMPKPVVGLGVARAVSAQGDHNCAILTDSTVQCWGANTVGQLGNGTTSNNPSGPVAVLGLSGATMLSPGCALLSDTTVQCWGANDFGELGNGTTTNSSIPVRVNGLTGVTTISSNGEATLVLVSDGTLQGWGTNDGQIFGDSTGMSSSDLQQKLYVVPVPVFEGLSLEFSPPQALAVGNTVDLAPLVTESSDLSAAFDTWTSDTCNLSYPVGGSVLSVLSSNAPFLCGVRATQLGGYNLHGGSLAPASSQVRSVPLETVVLKPRAVLNPASLTFGSIDVGVTSAAQTLTLSNSGSAALNISGISLTGAGAGQFNQTNSCGSTLAAGASCTISVSFTPAAAAIAGATVSVAANATGSPQTATLSGTGTSPGAPKAALSPASQDFGSFTIGSSGAAQIFTLSNAGTAALPITSTGISGSSAASFNISSNTCGALLAAGANCKISVIFKPLAAGAASASLNVYDSVGTQTSSMTGTGVAPAPAFTITPSALDFGNVVEGLKKTLNVTLNNVSSTAAFAVSITSSDPTVDPTSFYASCGGKSIPFKGNCTGSISFTPTAAKNYSATITLGIIETGCTVCTISYPNQTIAVSGVGVPPPPALVITPSALNFGNVIEGQTKTLYVTLTNVSSTIVVAKGGDPSDPAFNAFSSFLPSCTGVPIPAGGHCTGSIDFTPTAAKNYSATVTLGVVEAGCSSCTIPYPSQTFAVTGAGMPPPPALTIAPSALNFGDVIVGQTKSLYVTLINISTTNALPLTIVSSDPTLDIHSFILNCSYSPLPVGGSCGAYISFTPTAAKNYSATITLGVISTGCGCTIPYPNQTIPVTGVGVAPPPAFIIAPSSLDFGNVEIGQTKELYVTLTNVSATPAFPKTITSSDPAINISAFIIFCGTKPLEVGGSCSAFFSFTPTTAKSYSASVTLGVISTGCGCTIPYPNQTIAIKGVGVTPPPPTLTPSSYSFGNHVVGTDSFAEVFTFTNTQSTDLHISATIGGANPESFLPHPDPGGIIIAPGSTAAYYVYFSPKSVGALSATLSIAYSTTSGGPQQTLSASLAGVGVAQPTPTLTPATYAFGNQPIGAATAGLILDYTNTQSVALVVKSVTLGGLNPGSFSVTYDGCSGLTLAPGLICDVVISFIPTTTGPLLATISVASTIKGVPQPTITGTYTGTGVAQPLPTLTPSTLAFGNRAVGTATLDSAITFTNTQSVNVDVKSVTLGGLNPSSFILVDDGCSGQTLSPGFTCNAVVYFLPTTTGPLSATISVASVNKAGSQPTLTATLTGVGILQPAPTLTPSAYAFGTQLVGTKTYGPSLLFRNTQSTNLVVNAVTLGGANPTSYYLEHDFCSGVTLTPGLTCEITVDFIPTITGPLSTTIIVASASKTAPTITATYSGAGAAQPAPTLTPSTLIFGNQLVGTYSTTQILTFKNTQSSNLFVTSVTTGGINPDSFEIVNGCSGIAIFPGSSCSIYVDLLPKTTGPLSATISVVSSSKTAPTLTATLTGTGLGLGPLPPVFSPSGGTFTSKQIVTLSDANPGSTIHFTVDGSTPTAFSTAYALPIEVDKTETIRAIAVTGGLSGITLSAVSSASFTINLPSCQTVNYSSGFTASGVTLNGGATIDGSALKLTDGGPSEARSAFFSTTLPTTNFSTDFTFQITDPAADGMTFTIQSNSPYALGHAGGGLGYAGIPNSVAIKVDLYNNAGEGTDSIGTYVDGAYPSLPAINLGPAGIDLHSGHIFSGHLAYADGLTRATIKDTVTGVSASMNFPGDIAAVVGNNAWFGFTAGTGGKSATQKILTWSYSGGAGCSIK